MVDTEAPEFAAHVYKSYLACAARVIRSENGTITAYDGDRIMAVYTGAAGQKVDHPLGQRPSLIRSVAQGAVENSGPDRRVVPSIDDLA